MSTVISDTEAKSYISENIQRLLHARGLTANWLCVNLKMSPGALYPIVKGENIPSLATSARIAELLGASVDDLIQPPQTKKKIRNSA